MYLRRCLIFLLLFTAQGCGPTQQEVDMLRQELDLLHSMIDAENQVVSARKVQVVDGEGIERAVLSTTLPVENHPYMSPILTFLDETGQKRVYLMYSEEVNSGLFGWYNASEPLTPHQIRIDQLRKR